MPSAKLAKVNIKIPASYEPSFGISRWSKNDYAKPLIFKIDNAEARIFLEYPPTGFSVFPKLKIFPFPNPFIVLLIRNPSAEFIQGLKAKSGENTVKTAEHIYKIYVEVVSKLEILLRTVGGVKNLYELRTPPIEALFKKNILDYPVTFQIDSEDKKPFSPKFSTRSRRRNPLFKADQLVTPDKWGKMQRAIDNRYYASQEIIEILRIRAKLLGENKKLATLESAILFESLLRDYSRKTLEERGVSNTKVKEVSDELNFNNILNLLLPLSLKKAEVLKLRESINTIDALRKIRNKVIHGELTEDKIDKKIIEKGIEGGLKLIRFLFK